MKITVQIKRSHHSYDLFELHAERRIYFIEYWLFRAKPKAFITVLCTDRTIFSGRLRTHTNSIWFCIGVDAKKEKLVRRFFPQRYNTYWKTEKPIRKKL